MYRMVPVVHPDHDAVGRFSGIRTAEQRREHPLGEPAETVRLERDGGPAMVIHAMPLRPAFYALLPTQGEQP